MSVTKATVAAILEEISVLLELHGENPFKSRAYANGARVVANLDQDLEALVRDKKLSTVKGIGQGLAEKITTLVETGKLPYYDELQQGIPAGLLQMIRVQGVGPKKAKLLYEKLKISDIASLKKACEEGKIAQLTGFGPKSQENILQGIAFLSQHAESFRQDEAQQAADEVLAHLKKLKGLQRMSIGGSLRRCKEIIRDVDILVSAPKAEPVMSHFAAMPGIDRVLGQGDTKSSVLLSSGIQVDLRVVKDSEFAFALHYFTGSKEHNVAMRQRAIDKGYKLNEYGLYKKDGKSFVCKDESDLFSTLGLTYIPPEMREDRGEIELAEKKKLPKLIEEKDLKGAFHVHSTWSDGRASLEDMIAAAQELGWEYVGISDHSQSAAYAHGLEIARVKEQRVKIDQLRKKFKIHIFWGTECDILKDGSLDYPDDVLKNYDFVIGSVHSLFNLSEAEMTRRIVAALQNPYLTFLGHMTGRLLLKRDAYAVNVSEIIKAAADEGRVIEINANPRRLDMDWRHLSQAKEAGVRFSINPDAHTIEGLKDVSFGIGIARKGWLTSADVVNTQSLTQMKKWMAL